MSWRLYSVGPDNTHNFTDSTIVGLSVWQKQNMPYDATNGTVSHGDLYRYGSSDRGNKWQYGGAPAIRPPSLRQRGSGSPP